MGAFRVSSLGFRVYVKGFGCGCFGGFGVFGRLRVRGLGEFWGLGPLKKDWRNVVALCGTAQVSSGQVGECSGPAFQRPARRDSGKFDSLREKTVLSSSCSNQSTPSQSDLLL